MTEKQRILIISHGHPDFGCGGGEIAAYSLYKEFESRENCDAVFFARHDLGAAGHIGTPFSIHDRAGKEVLFYSQFNDFFLLSQPSKRNIWKHFRLFLERFKPTVVHFHHYLHLGIELIREVRNYSTTVPIIVTLHEYIAICHHNGQMVKTVTEELCRKASYVGCHQCFPDKAPEDFFLRESYLKSFFKLVDLFVSPSQFLIDRYAAWGISKANMVFIENGQPSYNRPSEAKGADENTLTTRFGFFGQLSRLKGIEILFEAFDRLPKSIKKSVTLDIYGANLHFQPEAFQRYFRKSLKKHQQWIQFHGAYRPEEIDKLMNKIGWVVIPSIWWENSPLVIQEAFKNNRPVICSDIGGMAEKVKDGTTGLHFRARDPLDLADKMTKAANNSKLWSELSANIVRPPSVKETADRHLELYKTIAV